MLPNKTQTRKLFVFEKIVLIAVLAASIWGFWYFEESNLLRIVMLGISLYALYTSFVSPPKKSELSSKRELLILVVLYLGLFTTYNFLYNLNLPLYSVMVVVLILITALFFGLLSLDKIDELIGKDVYRLFISLMGLVTLEVFLCLYFWSISPEVKSLIIVVIFYLITSLIYLYIHSMLRLRQVAGFVVASLIIFSAALLFTWFSLTK